MRKIFFSFLAIIILIAIPGISLYSARHNLESRVNELLASYGLHKAIVGNVTHQNGYMVYRDIRLDQDGFSTISDIQIPISQPDLMLRKKPETANINAVILSGEYTKDEGLNIAGWVRTPPPLPNFDRLALNSGQLDLLTTAGALRFQAKGQVSKQQDGTRKLQGAVWAEQNQLTTHTIWTGEISTDGRWVYDVDIQYANINFDQLQGSRMSGWVVFDKSTEIIPAISGQIDAGKLTIGNIDLMNARLTLSGSLTQIKLIGTASVGKYKDMAITIETAQKPDGPHIDATIETTSLDDMIAFLGDVQTSDSFSASLTSLLLTQGNLERLRKEIRKLSYDVLELQIYGSSYDLAGKVTAKRYKDGVSQNNVISLDPGKDAY